MGALLVISGSQHLLRRRCYQDALKKHYDKGYRLDVVNGKNPLSVRAALSGSVLFSESLLVVVNHPEEVDVSVWINHMKDGDDTTTVLLHYEGTPKGNTKFGKFVAGLTKKVHASFSASDKPWEQEPEAIKFCIDEFQTYNKTIDTSLAKAMVGLLGTDFGFLSFEVQKIAILADVAKSKEITPDIIKQGASFTSQVMANSVVDAIVTKNKKKVSGALGKVKAASKDDPTMMLCRIIEASAFKWLSVLDLRRKGIALDEGAAILGVNAWYLQNKTAPQVSNWTWDDVQKLIKILADAERSVLSGQLDSWIFFCSRILGFCDTSSV